MEYFAYYSAAQELDDDFTDEFILYMEAYYPGYSRIFNNTKDRMIRIIRNGKKEVLRLSAAEESAVRNNVLYDQADEMIHELGHIANGDVAKTGSYVDLQNPEDKRKETAADEFARQALLEQESYERFVAKGEFSYNSIKKYAQAQNVPTYIVIGRLQKDEIIPWKKYSKYKPKYKWAEL